MSERLAIQDVMDRVSAEIIKNTPPSSPHGRFLQADADLIAKLKLKPEHFYKPKGPK